MLFEKERHVTLEERKWNESIVRCSIREIIDSTIQTYSETNLWSKEARKSLYFGATGTLWGLIKVSDFLEVKLPFRFRETTELLYSTYLKSPDTKEVVPSFFLGESGILLLKLKYHYNKKDADRLYKICHENIQNPTLETLWGAPGTMLAAFHMLCFNKDDRWVKIINDSADFLITTLKSSIRNGEKIWEQDLYGRQVHYVGAGHGYFGNFYPLLKCIKYLKQEDQNFILENVCETTKALAIENSGFVNWPATLTQKKAKSPLVQWCHGAPGIINCLIDFPKNYDKEFELLLSKAGELVWKAGPLTKGVGLCHGTDGNGYTFLQLFKRTGDIVWLERARAFAMDAINHRKNDFSLFTGDIGLAVYLMSCITKEELFPALDTF